MQTVLNKKKVLSLVIFSLIAMSQKADIKNLDTEQLTTKSHNTEIIVTKTNAGPVALKCAEMDLLNTLLAIIPMNILRMKSSYKTASKILQTIELRKTAQLNLTKPETKIANALNQDEIIAYRNKLLKPVEKFFANLYSHQHLLKPLVVKILIGDNEIQNTNIEKYLFLQFFNVTKTKALTFFLDTLVTEQKLIQACEEFDILFGVVTASLSDEVIQKEQELIHLIKAKRKK